MEYGPNFPRHSSNRIVSDPVKSSFYSKLWLEQARTNTEAYDDAFAVVPTDRVKTMEECTKVGEHKVKMFY